MKSQRHSGKESEEHAFASASHTSLRNASPNNDALEDESIECFKD